MGDYAIKGLLRIINILLWIAILTFVAIVLVALVKEGLTPANSITEYINSYSLPTGFLASVITILTLVISVALPLSIQFVSQPQDKRYALDVSMLLFSERYFVRMFILIILLIVILVIYFFGWNNIYVSLFALGIGIYSLISFRLYLGLLIDYVTDFTNVLSKKAKDEISQIF